MDIVTLNGNKIKPKTIAAIGFFDGVHLAHQHLIETMIKTAKKHQMHTAIITFNVHPKSVLFDLDYTYLTPLSKKIELIKNYDVDTLYLIEFTKEKAQLTPETFIDYYLGGLSMLVCGFDFRFGVRASGSVETLKQYATFQTIVIEELTSNGKKIGSTQIRDLVISGHVDKVNDTLGDFYSISGQVIDGDKKGHDIGYPTANIDTKDYLIPKKGVYVSMTKVKSIWYRSMSTIGHNLTLNAKTTLSVESHILNFSQNIYGDTIEIKFIKRLRDEIKFDSVKALITQIDQDVEDALKIFEKM